MQNGLFANKRGYDGPKRYLAPAVNLFATRLYTRKGDKILEITKGNRITNAMFTGSEPAQWYVTINIYAENGGFILEIKYVWNMMPVTYKMLLKSKASDNYFMFIRRLHLASVGSGEPVSYVYVDPAQDYACISVPTQGTVIECGRRPSGFAPLRDFLPAVGKQKL